MIEAPLDLDLLMAKVKKGPGSDDCWLWTGRCQRGYGAYDVKVDGRWTHIAAHRVSYQLNVGPIPDGLVLDHLCRVKNCVRPDHLEAVTQRENVLRGMAPSAIAARRSTCAKGHDITDPANLYPDRSHPRERRCRICHNERERARRARKKQEADDAQV